MKKEIKSKKSKEIQLSIPKERLTNVRVIQKDLLYIIGLSPRISNKAVIPSYY